LFFFRLLFSPYLNCSCISQQPYTDIHQSSNSPIPRSNGYSLQGLEFSHSVGDAFRRYRAAKFILPVSLEPVLSKQNSSKSLFLISSRFVSIPFRLFLCVQNIMINIVSTNFFFKKYYKNIFLTSPIGTHSPTT
jgi:hypothetical protein